MDDDFFMFSVPIVFSSCRGILYRLVCFGTFSMHSCMLAFGFFFSARDDGPRVLLIVMRQKDGGRRCCQRGCLSPGPGLIKRDRTNYSLQECLNKRAAFRDTPREKSNK